MDRFPAAGSNNLVVDGLGCAFVGVLGHGGAAHSGGKDRVDPGLVPPGFIDGSGDQEQSQLVHPGKNLELFVAHAAAHVGQVPGFHMGCRQGGVIVLAQGKVVEDAVLVQAD